MDRLCCILFFSGALIKEVTSQQTAEEVYSLLSQRLYFENNILKNELQEIKTDLKNMEDIKVQLRNMEDIKVQLRNMEDIKVQLRNMEDKISALELSKNVIDKTNDQSDLHNKFNILEQGLRNEKLYARNLESAIIEMNKSMTQNLMTTDMKCAENRMKTEEMMNKMDETDTILADTQQDVEELVTNKKKIQHQIYYLNNSLNTLTDRIDIADASLEEFKLKIERKSVAFSAQLSETTSELSIGSIIIFDNVIYNDNGYNPANGIFTCPETGVYMFSVVLHCYHGAGGIKTLVGKLVVDSIVKAYVVSEKFHDGHNDQASNFVILKLNVGQKVWVKTYEFTAKVFRTFSTFSGALLHN